MVIRKIYLACAVPFLIGCEQNLSDTDVCQLFSKPEAHVGREINVEIILLYDDQLAAFPAQQCAEEVLYLPAKFDALFEDELILSSRDKSKEGIFFGVRASARGIIRDSKAGGLHSISGTYLEILSLQNKTVVETTEQHQAMIEEPPQL